MPRSDTGIRNKLKWRYFPLHSIDKMIEDLAYLIKAQNHLMFEFDSVQKDLNKIRMKILSLESDIEWEKRKSAGSHKSDAFADEAGV